MHHGHEMEARSITRRARRPERRIRQGGGGWFREVKTDPRRIDLQALGLKVAAFFRKNPDLRRERFGIGGLSLDDM